MEEAAVLAGLGWVASPIIKDLINKSTSYLGSDIAKGLEDLETSLLPQFQLTIEAAQHSPPYHRALFARWLARLKNAYYDAEAILHDLEYDRLKRKAKAPDKELSVHLSSKPIIITKFTGRVVKNASIFSLEKRKLKLLQRLNKLKEVAAQAKTFRDLMAIKKTGNSWLLTDRVFGRDGDRDEIINYLLDEHGARSLRKSYSVVAVTSMGGAGKTTLAQLVYNDERVKEHFGMRMWLSLSRNLDITKHTKEMIEYASGKECPNLRNLGVLQNKLIETLPESGKIMVVLDDVWYDNGDYDREAGEQQWGDFLAPFASYHFRGGICKILITSRSTSFPSALLPEKLIKLSDLAPDNFISLLRYHTIDDLSISNPQLKNDLIDIVDQIAKKMSKSPLVAKVVGNQLRERPDIAFWRDTLEKVNLINTMEIFLWSFQHFDVQLQRCFLFCSLFPKGTRFCLHTLVSNWVALDFIQCSHDNKNVEDIGLEYFEIMVANSIFHRVERTYIMHDLFHDLAEKLSAEDCFRVTNVEKEISLSVRHLFLEVNNKNLKSNLSSICNLNDLRTLILGNPVIDEISEIISKKSTNFRNLRVLHVMSRGYKTLPRVVGGFRNLRLLSIWESSLEELPDSVLQLYHLQFLLLPSSVKTLPTKLSNLINLRHIEMYNSDGHQVNTLPPIPYLGKLNSLQGLDEFHVRKEEGYELQQLGRLNEIGGSLRILNLENVRDKDEAVEARLIDKPKLKKLELVWAELAETNGLEIEVIEALRPPANLESLRIDGYMGSTYPTWLQEGSFRENIEVVRFYNCHALTTLPVSIHQFHHCSEFVLENLGALTELSTFPKNLARLSIIKCPCLIFVSENELQVNEYHSPMESPYLEVGVESLKDILDHELKSFKQTCSIENCAEQLQIMESATKGNAPELSVYVNVIKAWWCCHQQRMNYIFRCNTQANKLKLPSMLRILYLGYCCVSDGALSDCLRGMTTLEELYLWGIMTITTLPPAQVLESLLSLRVVEIKHCWYLRSLDNLHALPHLERFLVQGCWCLMDSGYTPLPPTLHSFTIITCKVPQAILNGNLPCLQNVKFYNCLLPNSLSFRQLTKLKSLQLCACPGLSRIDLPSSLIKTLQLLHLPDLVVESILESWQGCQTLCISSWVMLNKLLSSQQFVPPQWLGIKYCQEEGISFEKSVHLQSIKELLFIACKTMNLPKTLNDFSTLEVIDFIDCPEISGLPELPDSVQHIGIRGCPLLEYSVGRMNDSRRAPTTVYIPDDDSNYSELADDAFELTPVVNPINCIVPLVLPPPTMDYVSNDDGYEHLSHHVEETTLIFGKTDPFDIVTTLSSSDKRKIPSPENDHSPDEDDAFKLTPDMNPIYRIVPSLVLPCLPARSLLRFKSVSFNFKTLISSPYLVLSHFLHPKSISGLFYQTWCSIHYVSLDAPSTNIPDPSFSYLPEPVTIKASTHGVLCVRGQRSLKYYITNPTTMEWAELPEPTVEHCDNVGVVVVFDSLYNWRFSYWVVCVYPVNGVEGVYTFETFSLETWAWALSDQTCAVEHIVAQSGTAVGAMAYWRTAMETVLSYDPVKDRSNIMQKPHTDMNEVSWELGEMDRHLSVTCTSNLGQIKVSTMEATNKMEMPKWEEMGGFWLSESAYAIPIRSQGLAGLAFWEYNEDVIGLVLRDMEGRQVSRFEMPNYYGDFVYFPYISTLAPVKRSGAGTSAELQRDQTDLGVTVEAESLKEEEVRRGSGVRKNGQEFIKRSLADRRAQEGKGPEEGVLSNTIADSGPQLARTGEEMEREIERITG